MSGKFCELCSCTGSKSEGMPDDLNKNWKCPLLDKKNICLVCCQMELEGGMAAADTLGTMCAVSRKSPLEVHNTCVSCKHGGKGLLEPRKLISAMGKDGKQKKGGPEFEAARKESEKWHRDRLRWLKTVEAKDLPRLRS